MSEIVIKNARIDWAVLEEAKENLFGDVVYSLTMVARDKAQAKDWEKAGLNVKTDKNDQQVVYLKSKAKSKDGKDLPKPRTVNAHKEPWDFSKKIGNGTTANIIVSLRDNPRGKGKISYLNAVQVVNLVEYKPDGADFDVLDALDVDTVDLY